MKLKQELGAALGTKTPSVENVDDQLMYETFYSFPISDGMTITPIIYVKEVTEGDNETAVILKSSYSFKIYLININRYTHLRPLLKPFF